VAPKALAVLSNGGPGVTKLSDVSCVVKVLSTTDGKRVPDKGAVFTGGSLEPAAIVRYIVVNDSDVAAGPFTLTGNLFRDGVVQNVISEAALTVPAQQLWKKEFPISEDNGTTGYIAYLEARGSAKEEDSNNNHAATTFTVTAPAR
jgi:hypothetical protein